MANVPSIKVDPQGIPIQESANDVSFRLEYDGSNNLIYSAFARAGSSTADPVWKIQKFNYVGTNMVSGLWPQNTLGKPSNNYEFIWDDHLSYTYG